MENSLNGKMWVDGETLGKPSKWLTDYALRVLSHFGRAPLPDGGCASN
jgi:ribonucleotide monophosphatase NagD (HAD superfamily)